MFREDLLLLAAVLVEGCGFGWFRSWSPSRSTFLGWGGLTDCDATCAIPAAMEDKVIELTHDAGAHTLRRQG